MRTPKAIQETDSLQFPEIRKQFQKDRGALSAKDSRMTIKLMTDQLHDNREMIWQVLLKDFGKMNIWAKFDPRSLRKERNGQRIEKTLVTPSSQRSRERPLTLLA